MYSAGGDVIGWAVNSAGELGLSATTLYPIVDAGLDLGSDTYEWKDLWINGTGYFDAITMHGNIAMGSNLIEGLGDPDSGDDAMDRDYADDRYLFEDSADTAAGTITFTAATGIIMQNQSKIQFDSADTYIYANTDDPEDLYIKADEDILLMPDGNVGIGTTAPGKTLDVRGDAIFNEDGGDYDFRIEGDTDINLFFVDASGDNIGIGKTPAAAYLLDVDGKGYFADNVTISGNLSVTDIDASGSIHLANYLYHRQDTDTYLYFPNGTGDKIQLFAGAVNFIDILEDGTQDEIAINEGGADVDFRVEASGVTDALFVQGSDGNVGIGITDPTNDLHIPGPSNADYDGGGVNSALRIGVDGGINTVAAENSYGNIVIGNHQIYTDQDMTASIDDAIQALTFQTQDNADSEGNYINWAFLSSGEAMRLAIIQGTAGYANQFYDSLIVGGAGYVTCSSIAGIGHIDCGVTGAGDLYVADDIEADGLIFIDGAGDNYFAGNVGIGTTNPYAYDTTATRFHVDAGAVEVARFEGQNDANGAIGVIRIGTSNDRGIYLEGGRNDAVPYAYGAIGITNASGVKTEAIRIDASGNVGIGTTAPGEQLSLNYSGAVQGQIFMDSGDDLYIRNSKQNNQIIIYDGGSGIEFYYNGSLVAEIDTTGGMEIKTGNFGVEGNIYDISQTTLTVNDNLSVSGNITVGGYVDLNSVDNTDDDRAILDAGYIEFVNKENDDILNQDGVMYWDASEGWMGYDGGTFQTFITTHQADTEDLAVRLQTLTVDGTVTAGALSMGGNIDLNTNSIVDGLLGRASCALIGFDWTGSEADHQCTTGYYVGGVREGNSTGAWGGINCCKL